MQDRDAWPVIDHFGWDLLWGGGNYLGGYSFGMADGLDPRSSRLDADLLGVDRPGTSRQAGDPHLRSLNAVVDYHVQASDEPIGHVENFLVDDQTWDIHYLIVDTRNWWPGRHVLISPGAVRGISWGSREVILANTRAVVEDSPAWDPAAVITRDYQRHLHSHYGWPGYGW